MAPEGSLYPPAPPVRLDEPVRVGCGRTGDMLVANTWQDDSSSLPPVVVYTAPASSLVCCIVVVGPARSLPGMPEWTYAQVRPSCLCTCAACLPADAATRQDVLLVNP